MKYWFQLLSRWDKVQAAFTLNLDCKKTFDNQLASQLQLLFKRCCLWGAFLGKTALDWLVTKPSLLFVLTVSVIMLDCNKIWLPAGVFVRPKEANLGHTSGCAQLDSGVGKLFSLKCTPVPVRFSIISYCARFSPLHRRQKRIYSHSLSLLPQALLSPHRFFSWGKNVLWSIHFKQIASVISNPTQV